MSEIAVKKRRNRIGDPAGDRVLKVVVVTLVTLLTLTCVLPLLNIFATSLSSAKAITSNKVVFWPIDLSTDAYKTVFTSGPLMKSMSFSIMITIIQVLFSVIMTVLIAYPLSESTLVGRKPLWMFVLFTMYFSGGMIPMYLLLKNMSLLNTMWCLILPGLISTYNMILMRTYFCSIPGALKEAALIDGANDATVLARVILPLSKSMLATIALFYGVSRWNAVQDGMIYITDPNKYILQVRLNNIIMSSSAMNELISEGSSTNNVILQSEQIRSASLCFSIIPVMVVYPFLQKYFVKGVMIGSVKG